MEERCLPEVHTPGWNNVDEEIIEGMKSADKEVLKTIELLGMLPNLLKGNVLRQEGDKLIYLNRAVDTWIDSGEFMPDESTVVSLEELAELDNGILFDSLDTLDENSNYLPLTDLAATVSSVTDLDGGDLDNVDDDDGHPRNCVFYAKGSCKYLDNSFVRPKKTSWIGCEFPGCNDWYHGTCLGIQLAQSEKESYTFICNKHAEGKGILKDKYKLVLWMLMFSPKKLVQLPVCSQNGKGQTNLLVKKKITLDYHLTWNMKAIITTSRSFCRCKREKFTGQHHRVLQGGCQVHKVTFTSA